MHLQGQPCLCSLCSGWKHLLLSSAFAFDTGSLKQPWQLKHSQPTSMAYYCSSETTLSTTVSKIGRKPTSWPPQCGLLFPSSCSWLKALNFTLRWLRHESHEGAVACSSLWWGNVADQKGLLSATVSWCSSSTLGKPKTTPKAGGRDTSNYLEPSSRRKSSESTDRRSTVCWKFFSTGQLGKLWTWKEKM